MVVEIKHKTFVELKELSAGDCFIYDDTAYMLLENNDDYIKQSYNFPYTAVMLKTGKINQIASYANVIKANAKVIIEWSEELYG